MKKAELWQEIIVDGKSSIQNHEPKLIKEYCREEDHDWEIIDSASRTIKCKRCGMENHFVVGLEQIVNGKIVRIH